MDQDLESTYLFFDTMPSTHTWMKTWLDSLSTSCWISLRAATQTEGHGQFKRKWIAPRGGLWVSFLVPLITSYQMHTLATVLANSLISVLVAKGIYPKLKAPNDLMLQNKKLSGVLVEICEREKEKFAICSYGINVNIDISELEGVDQPVTSLQIETKETWDLEELYNEIKEQFQRDFQVFESYGYAPFAFWQEEWKI